MKWEYEIITLDHFLNSDEGLTTQEKLNKYGTNGWEFMGVVQKPYATVERPPKLDSDSLVFKRAIGE